jgi:hypothetical protein
MSTAGLYDFVGKDLMKVPTGAALSAPSPAPEEIAGLDQDSAFVGGKVLPVYLGGNIQAAIDTVAAAGGGEVRLVDGTYIVNNNLVIPSGVVLVGTGPDSIIDFGGGAYGIIGHGTLIDNTGTISMTDGSATVTGSGTAFTAAMVDETFMVNGVSYLITARASATSITVSPTYYGQNLSGSAYIVFEPLSNPAIRHLTIQNASGTAIDAQYIAGEFITDSVNIYDCGRGMVIDHVEKPVITDSTLVGFTVGDGISMTDVASVIYEGSFVIGVTNGHCMKLTRVYNSGFHNAEFSDASGDGINLTTCSNMGLENMSITRNGGQGIEFASGCFEIQVNQAQFEGNGSDGIKLTLNDDRIVIAECNFARNGGYGINIAAATCDNNVIGLNTYDSNTSGTYQDLGTGTSIIDGTLTGPATSTDNAVVRWDGTAGQVVQDSVVTIADTTGNMAGVGTLNTHTIQGGTSTLAMYSNNLSVFASTTSLQLKTLISNETGSGSLVFADTPTLVTPVLGAATATSINNLAITAPASLATLTIASGKTVTLNNTLTFSGTDATTMTFPSTTATIARTDAGQTFTGVNVFTSPKILTDISDTNGNELFKVTATGSAVNEITVANAATAANPSLTATGGDTDVGISLVAKGAGTINVGSALGYARLWVQSPNTLADVGETTNYGLFLNEPTTTNGHGAGIGFNATTSPGTSNVGAAIVYNRTGAGSQGKLEFYTKASTSNGVDPVLAMTINNDQTVVLSTVGTAAGSIVTIDGAQTLTSKTLTSPIMTTPTLGVASATSLATSAASPLLLTNGQLVTIALTSQTVGGATLTIPNFASVNDTFAFITLAQTFANKTLTSPVINTATIGTSLKPTSDDGAPLGDTTHNFSDLFLASGAVLNYANGNVTITQTSGILTMGVGTLKITTPTNTTTSVVTIDGTQTLTNKSMSEAQVTFTDITTGNASTSNHGFLKKLDNSSAHFMDGQGNWSTPPSGIGYLIRVNAGLLNNVSSPGSGQTYYLQNGGINITAITTAHANAGTIIYIPKAGTIKAAYGVVTVGGTTSSGEDSTIGYRLNNTTNTNIATTVETNAAVNAFSNNALSTSVALGDYIEVFFTTPTFVTAPTIVYISVSLYIE